MTLYETDNSLEGEKIDAVRARKRRNLPVVMTKDEVKKVIMAMSGVNQLMAKLIYGSGKNRFWKLFSQTWRLLLKVTFATLGIILTTKNETFEKCSILFKAKEGENFNHRNTLSILRIKI